MEQNSFQDIEQLLSQLNFPPFTPRTPGVQGLIEMVKLYNLKSDFERLAVLIDNLERILSITCKESAPLVLGRVRQKMEGERLTGEVGVELLQDLNLEG